MKHRNLTVKQVASVEKRWNHLDLIHRDQTPRVRAHQCIEGYLCPKVMLPSLSLSWVSDQTLERRLHQITALCIASHSRCTRQMSSEQNLWLILVRIRCRKRSNLWCSRDLRPKSQSQSKNQTRTMTYRRQQVWHRAQLQVLLTMLKAESIFRAKQA